MKQGYFGRCVAIVAALAIAVLRAPAVADDRQLLGDFHDFPAHIDAAHGPVRLAQDATRHKYCTDAMSAKALPIKRFIDGYAAAVERAIASGATAAPESVDGALGAKLLLIRADRSYAIAVSRTSSTVPIEGMRALFACSSISDGEPGRARALGLYTPPGGGYARSLYYSPLIGLYLA